MMPTTLHARDVTNDDLERTAEFAASLPQGSPIAVMLQQVLVLMHRGADVSFLDTGEELTPNQAADLLNVSRPYLLKVMDRGLLAYRTVGSNRRIAMADLLDYIDRHERANAYVNRILDTPEHARRVAP